MKKMIKVKPIGSLDKKTWKWVKLAAEVRKRAYAPYSKFLVGSCIVDEVGNLHTGCNVENASFTAGICAERAAIASLVSQGGDKIACVVIVGSSDELIFPCGVCRQVIVEFGPSARVITVNKKLSKYCEMNVSDLYPYAFSREAMGHTRT